MVNSMSPASLCRIVRNSLDPQTGLKSPYDALACLSHACMLTAGFTFLGLGEDHQTERQITNGDLSALPAEWNTSSSSAYAFRYSHSHLASDYMLRVSRLGTKTLVFGSSGEDDKTTSFELSTAAYTDLTCYPWKPDGHSHSLADAYVSMAQIKDFSNLFITKLLQKTIEDEEDQDVPDQEKLVQPLAGRASRSVRPDDPSVDPQGDLPRPGYDPLRVQPRPDPVPSDWPPEFEDEHQMQGSRRGNFGGPGGYGGVGGIGADDLRPPGIDAMNPFGRSGGHRGMHPTPEDILYPGREDSHRGDFPGGPPAGARYDPVFPGDRNGLRGGRDLGRGGFNQFNMGGGGATFKQC
ncbi:Putative uncharacterized protein [Taphrina deformans PYCC 5710]|uniref:Uncharacterized protein n=1 Tax=Taphrina deformans (strain PYCC 5710 / ATCC 11124 / CBS 356.35 / IMI 108563 / JCM 9778 / NBRC 8474) TaxID=1097556 RepID=R4XFQ3_TAPDE|nr:Putative uncharacterized protein [Taphrina deformans PYCC 5710]|eukprot:CCG82182.1 Putative uncharacterized protein [Taphrina deformans PYCC 5710]